VNRHDQSLHHAEGLKLFYGLLALVVWAPLPLGGARPWADFLLCGLIFLLAFFWLLQYARGKLVLAPAFKAACPAMMILLFVQLWVFVQTLPSPLQTTDIHITQTYLIRGLAYTATFALVLLLVINKQRMRQLGYAIVLSGVLQATYGSFMYLSGLEYGFFFEKTTGRGVATGTFVNRNHLAGYLEMALAVGVGLLLAELAKGKALNWRDFYRRSIQTLIGPKLRLRLYLAIMVIALVLTRSRMGNTAFFSSLIIAGMVGLYLQQRLTRNAIILFVSLLLVDALIVGNWFGIDKVAKRIANTAMVSEQRDESNIYSLAMARDHWLTGTGAGSFKSNFPAYRGADINQSHFYAHNDYLQFVIEFGMIGALPLASLVLLSLYLALLAQRKRRSSLIKGVGFAASMGILALGIHSAVDFNLQIPSNGMLFVILLAMAWWARYYDDLDGHHRHHG